MDPSQQWEWDKHVNYFLMFLDVVPEAYTSLDTSRLMIVYFALSGLDVMGALDRVPADVKERTIEWVYEQQVVVVEDRNGAEKHCGGFLGGGFLGPMNSENVTKYHQAHISMTYCALLVLTILGDDFSRVDKKAVVEGIKSLQQPDGSFQAVAFGTEKDMRFVFCACAVSFMLQDFSSIDVEKTAQFIISSQSYDGGYGILPDQESHSGAIYTAIASLKLLGRIDDSQVDKESLLHFLVSRQVGGLNGRINKVPDTCYTFWVGGALQALGHQNLLDYASTKKFLLSCQTPFGGFSKHAPNASSKTFPDILHSYTSICGLSLMGEPGVNPIEATVGLSKSTFDRAPFANGLNGSGSLFCNIQSYSSGEDGFSSSLEGF